MFACRSSATAPGRYKAWQVNVSNDAATTVAVGSGLNDLLVAQLCNHYPTSNLIAAKPPMSSAQSASVISSKYFSSSRLA